MSGFPSAVAEIAETLKKIPKKWVGRNAILEMKAAGSRHWKQMEWIGFYFQFMCEKYLLSVVEMPGPRYGNARFDGFKAIPWDFKAHTSNTSSHQIIINDTEAITNGIRDFGSVGVIISVGEVRYNDEDRTFQKWHEALKGGKSKYEIDRIARGAWSRLRKVTFELQQISFIKITTPTLNKAASFQVNFRNADGSPRRAKVLLDLEKIDKELIHSLNFN